MSLSVTQLDKLGQRLKQEGQPSDDDLRMLDEYRRSFEAASSTINQILRSEFDLQPTMRPAKSTKTIVDKLRRQQTRLTRIQDIAGCRVIVGSLAEQEGLVAKLKAKFSDARQIDRLKSPSHGYRAQHLVVKVEHRLVEIQIRTEWQHLWAAMSEKAADEYGHEIKYGAGPEELRTVLLTLSEQVHTMESIQERIERAAAKLRERGELELIKGHDAAVKELNVLRNKLRDALELFSADPNNLTGEP